MSPPLIFDPELLTAAILLLPAIGLGIAMLIRRPTYFQAVGMMLGILLSIPYLFLFNILAEYLGWWRYTSSINSYYNIPVEVVLGWSIFWGAFLPYIFRSTNTFIPIITALVIDLWTMPMLSPVFTLGEYWLLGEAILLSACLLPSIMIFKLTEKRRHVITRALIQSFIWGGWTIFFIPSIVLFIESKSIFDFFAMKGETKVIFLLGMAVSITIGYMALFEFARAGKGTPIPFDPPQKLVTTGIYGYVANPLQISTLLIFICIMFSYQSWIMTYPIITLIVYSEGFVRWHHSVDIENRLGEQWLVYRRNVRNWVPNLKAYSSNKAP